MSYLVRASFRLPFEPHPVHRDLIKKLVTGKQWLRLVSSDRLVSVMKSYDDKQVGLATAKSFGQGLQQILDCDVQGTVHVTELGAREDVLMEFVRRKKAESVKKSVNAAQLTLSFSASFSSKGAKGEFVLACDGLKVFGEGNISLPAATNVHEAVYDCLDVALMRVIEYCKSCNIEMALAPMALVSPSQQVIKQLRGEWKIDAPGLIERAVRCQKMLDNFKRSAVSFHTPQELALPVSA